MGSIDIGFAEDLPREVAELIEPTDEDDTERGLLQAEVVQPFGVPSWESQAGLYESSAVRALTPFRLRAFSVRGSPLA